MKKFTYRTIKNIAFALTITLSLIPFFGYSTHIVGGELNYKCLGNNLYEIRLRVYRDCITAQADFDKPATIGIFDANNTYITSLSLPFPGKTQLPPTLAQKNPCVKVPSNVCVEVAEYVGTVTLPPITGGYQLAYQRCCRNPTISNLTNPGNQGATYYARIPDKAIACNSNPVFKEWPPIFVCANNEIVFDHSATDADGDSIHYELCTPFSGGTNNSPKPVPPNNPPYNFVNWKSPYNANDPLGGVPLTINPQTGVLNGIPTTLGQFVVGVCANEYRNGVLISTTKRDFQFNVVECQPDVVAAAVSFLSNCTNHTVTFINNSSGTNNFSWNFGDPNTTTDVSTLTDPTYTYPSSGTFTVRLIAFHSTTPECNDTLDFPVTIDTCKPCGMTLATSKVDATCGATCSYTTPVVGTKSVGSIANGATTMTWNHNMAGSDRFLLVEVATMDGPSSGATYAGQSMTFIGSQTATITGGSDPLWIEMYYLVNPPTGTNSIVVTFPTPAQHSDSREGHGITITGVDQTTPLNGTVTKANGNSCPATTTIPTGPNELVIDMIGRDHDQSDAISPLPGQTALYAFDDVKSDGDYMSSSMPGTTGSVTVGYNWPNCSTNPYIWMTLGISIKPSCTVIPGCGVVPITITEYSSQTPPNPDPCPGTGRFVYYAAPGCDPDPYGTSPDKCYYVCGGSFTPPDLFSDWGNCIEPAVNPCPGKGAMASVDGGFAQLYVCPCETPAGVCTHIVWPVSPVSSFSLYRIQYGNGQVFQPGSVSGTANVTGLTWPLTPSSIKVGTTLVTLPQLPSSPPATITPLTNTHATCPKAASVTVDIPGNTVTYDYYLWVVNTSGGTGTSTPGSATVTATGGTAPYTYSWTPGGQTTNPATNLGPGTYTITVADAANCVQTTSVTIDANSNIALTTSQTNPSTCGSADGSASVSATGGSGQLSYLWSNGATDASVTGLPAGVYTVNVADSAGCSKSATITIGQPTTITVTASKTDVRCTGSNSGTATANTPVGGTGPYTFSWSTSPVQTTQTATGLAPGYYTVLTTDINGCTATASVTVLDSSLVATSSETDALCNGGASGTATITATGGTMPYTYLWSSSPVQTTPTATGLTAGTYTGIITDNTGCKDTVTVTISEPPLLDPETQNTSTIACSGSTNGSATVFVNGGTSPYTYLWCNGTSMSNVSGLPAGYCTVTVTDANGCAVTDSVNIVFPNPLTLSYISSSVLCAGDKTGSSTVDPMGGSPGYTYSWSTVPVQNSQTATGLAPGTYSVVVTDNMGCTASLGGIVISQPLPLTVTTSKTDVSCPGANDGTATVSVSGGTPGYNYSWINITPVQTTSTITGLQGGTYTNYITDANGCDTLVSVTVLDQGTMPTADFVYTLQPTCYDGMFATFVNWSSGAGSWLWIFGDGTTSTEKNPLHGYEYGSNYTVTFIAFNGSCSDTITKTISIVSFEDLINPAVPNVFTPNSDGENDVFQINVGNGLENCVSVTIFDRWGLKMYENWDGVPWDGRTKAGKLVPSGTYFYLVSIGDFETRGTLTLLR